jgi:hypothetical protein
MEDKENLPALDSEDLRKLNSKKIVDAVDNIGQHFAEIRKWNKVSLTIAAATGLLMLLLIGTIVYASFSIKGTSFIDTMVDRDGMAMRYKCCTLDDNCAIFRLPASAHDFQEIYPEAKCIFWDVRTKVNE